MAAVELPTNQGNLQQSTEQNLVRDRQRNGLAVHRQGWPNEISLYVFSGKTGILQFAAISTHHLKPDHQAAHRMRHFERRLGPQLGRDPVRRGRGLRLAE